MYNNNHSNQTILLHKLEANHLETFLQIIWRIRELLIFCLLIYSTDLFQDNTLLKILINEWNLRPYSSYFCLKKDETTKYRIECEYASQVVPNSNPQFETSSSRKFCWHFSSGNFLVAKFRNSIDRKLSETYT